MNRDPLVVGLGLALAGLVVLVAAALPDCRAVPPAPVGVPLELLGVAGAAGADASAAPAADGGGGTAGFCLADGGWGGGGWGGGY